MKTIFIILGFIAMCETSFAQFMGYLTVLDDSDKEAAFAEVKLVHRSRASAENAFEELGTTTFMLPKVVCGKEIKIVHNRFRITEGHPFIRDDKSYVQTFLFYDNETLDPRDDIFIIALPFEVRKDLIDSELQHYEGEKYDAYNFVSAKMD